MDATRSAEPKTIVIPRQLEDHFSARLMAHFGGRSDVRVVVDRRVGERRRPRWTTGAGPFTDRRRGDRRDTGPEWSLPDLPFSTD